MFYRFISVKRIVSLIVILLSGVCAHASIANSHMYLKKITIVNDTVFVDGRPYCLLKQVDGTYTISTLDISEIMYIQPIVRNQKEYYKISISPLRETYYTEKTNAAIRQLVKSVVDYQLIEDRFFSAYGANMFIKEGVYANELKRINELPKIVTPDDILKQKIIWQPTDNVDSTLILSGDEVLAYYTKRHWREYGIERRHVRVNTESTYRYFIYKTSDNTPLAEVRVADWWQTEVTIITPDGWTYQFKNVPKTDDLMRIAAKLVLLRESLK